VIAAELTIGGRTRRFALRLPRAAGDGPGGEIPLVLVLHGNHPEATGAQMRDWTSFDAQSDAWGFAVAYPDGHGGCWAAGTQVVSWTVTGGGHTWPGSEPYPGLEQATSREFDAAAEICRFARPLLAPATARRLA
jgi:poly(3-hydroxybutyrate) depolymerase